MLEFFRVLPWSPFFSHPILASELVLFLVTNAIAVFPLVTLQIIYINSACSCLNSSDTLLYLVLCFFCCCCCCFIFKLMKKPYIANCIKLFKFWYEVFFSPPVSLGEGCQIHIHRGPHQPHGRLQRAECDFRTA